MAQRSHLSSLPSVSIKCFIAVVCFPILKSLLVVLIQDPALGFLKHSKPIPGTAFTSKRLKTVFFLIDTFLT